MIRALVLILLGLLGMALVAVIADFTGFIDRAQHSLAHEAGPDEAEAVTALTGASNARLVEGLRLAEEMNAPLLISGVHVDTSAADIAEVVGVPLERITCCVTLGRAAASTAGNGAEVADWARRLGVTRIVVVTSEYHMDRAMVELRRAMPEGEFIPHAVQTLSAPPRDWWRNPALGRRLFEEWMKFRIASMRAANTAPATPQPDAPERNMEG